MKTWVSVLLIITLGASFAGCSTVNSNPSNSSKTYIGMFSGALLGGLGGSAIQEKGGGRLTYIAVGALLGALAGGSLGMILDEQDREAPKKTLSVTNDPHDKTFHVTTSLNQSAQQEEDQPFRWQISDIKRVGSAYRITVKKKLTSIWKNLPSTQWFVDNGKRTDLG